MNWLTVLVVLTLSSCSLYRSSFDCKVPSGMRCKSVTEIEAMIVESEEGDDYLCREKTLHPVPKRPPKTHLEPLRTKPRVKVWICPHLDPKRGYVEGHFIHINVSKEVDHAPSE